MSTPAGDPEVRWLDSLEQRAARVLPEATHRYFRQGAGAGLTAAEAAAAWDRYRVLPRVLRTVTGVDVATSILGVDVASPYAVAPTTLQRAAHPDGERATAQAVASAGSLLVLSSNAGTTFAEVSATGAPWWLQAYLPPDRPAARPMLERAVAAGARAVVLTADTPVVARKQDGGRATVWDEADPSWTGVNRDRHAHGAGTGAKGTGSKATGSKATDLGPHDIGWLRDVTGLPVVVKGVLRADDAERCVEAGASAVWVSNHGGRQLDGAASTAHGLPAVVGAVGAGAEVYVDGGIRSARHALTALALGAQAVFLGRPVLYALADSGAAGVRRVLDELAEDLREALALSGCAGIEDLDAEMLTMSH